MTSLDDLNPTERQKLMQQAQVAVWNQIIEFQTAQLNNLKAARNVALNPQATPTFINPAAAVEPAQVSPKPEPKAENKPAEKPATPAKDEVKEPKKSPTKGEEPAKPKVKETRYFKPTQHRSGKRPQMASLKFEIGKQL